MSAVTQQAPDFRCFTRVDTKDAVLLEYFESDLKTTREALLGAVVYEATDIMRVVFEAIYRIMHELPAFSGYEYPNHGLVRFRPASSFVEEGGRAEYQVFQVVLRHFEAREYAYIVLDVLREGADLRAESIRTKKMYRLRGISKPMQAEVPDNTWCNQREQWVYWNGFPQDFNMLVM